MATRHDIDTVAFLDGLAFAREQLALARSREAEAVADIERWEVAVRGIEEALRLQGLIDALESGELDERAVREKLAEKPRGSEAALAVMREKDQLWTARQVHEELESRGWISPDVKHPRQGTEAAMNRLLKAGKIERLRRGRYRVKS
jgi:hypothetical protein